MGDKQEHGGQRDSDSTIHFQQKTKSQEENSLGADARAVSATRRTIASFKKFGETLATRFQKSPHGQGRIRPQDPPDCRMPQFGHPHQREGNCKADRAPTPDRSEDHLLDDVRRNMHARSVANRQRRGRVRCGGKKGSGISGDEQETAHAKPLTQESTPLTCFRSSGGPEWMRACAVGRKRSDRVGLARNKNSAHTKPSTQESTPPTTLVAGAPAVRRVTMLCPALACEGVRGQTAQQLGIESQGGGRFRVFEFKRGDDVTILSMAGGRHKRQTAGRH
ncbi:hypothetical protein BDK51DRAFT_25853 [Blyttiomyces helicus]|uniref:Uncharacterized protein n=1 Tax=Blyttiomyces helicus TaxID=388810 RepID=A0A4P9W5I1_9FUNG|nr:hypothetical protein BDK51DRAFT_25853 [Blyttiomyces helicus]|eukprot:RKO87212.1 hypothetical protein BDK51DRAFT_25853 [Blyttiomyces helicus]